jgi:predicted nucleotidyltransferase
MENLAIESTRNYYINALVENIKQADPKRIVLFGSCAKGAPTENSDIDMMVILDSNYISRNYDEYMSHRIAIKNLVRELEYNVPLDILVYSKEEYKMGKNAGNVMINEIDKTGKVIYEKSN